MSSSEIVNIRVTCQCAFEYNPIRDIHAARVRSLGLTAYGTTQDEAVESLRGLLDRCLRAYQAKDMLDNVLNREGIKVERIHAPRVIMNAPHAGGVVAAEPTLSHSTLEHVLAQAAENWRVTTGDTEPERISVVV